MSTLLDLVKAYGDARAEEVTGRQGYRQVSKALGAVEDRIQEIREAVYSVHGVDETVPAILDGMGES